MLKTASVLFKPKTLAELCVVLIKTSSYILVQFEFAWKTSEDSHEKYRQFSESIEYFFCEH
jgi:hypothetical protein